MEAVLHVPGADAGVVFGPDGDDAGLACAAVVPEQDASPTRRAADGAGKYYIRILRVRRDVPAFRTAHRPAVGPVDGDVVSGRRHHYGCVVLLRSVDVVGEPVVRVEGIKLRGELVVEGGPGVAAVE